MILLVAVLVSSMCIAASARRVWFAANATALDPGEIVVALSRARERGPEAVAELRALVASEKTADWERDLIEALASPPAHRVALVNEQLGELDYRIQRWSRVPRVCASIATSTGFMLATLVLRNALADARDLPLEAGEFIVRGLAGDALTVMATGIVGTAFCIAAQSEAKRIAKARTKNADKLVEYVETLMGAGAAG